MKNHIVFIPPSGKFKKQDFSIQRICKWLNRNKNYKTTLLYIKTNGLNIDINIFDDIIEVSNTNDILNNLKQLDFDIIFSRSWMHSYSFTKKLVQMFDNVVVNLKDWNFCSQEEYEFLFDDSSDFEAVEYIFRHSKYVLSHFTYQQTRQWSSEYNIDENKFIFFPEYCNEESFVNKELLYENIKIVYAGRIQPTSYPEELFPAKSHLRSSKILTNNKIDVSFVLPEKEYSEVIRRKNEFLDFLYEDKFNTSFNLVKGEDLNPNILNTYHFGFFELETSGVNKELYKYAVTSKFAFYLEAGLPILVNNDFIAMADIVSSYNLGIVFCNEDLVNLHNILDISQGEYNEFLKNIREYRKEFTYESQILQFKQFDIFKYQ